MHCRRIVVIVFLIVAAVMVYSGSGAAQTAVSSLQTLCPSARAWGMGLTGTADGSDPANAWFNPAAISFLDYYAITSGKSQLVPDLASDVWTFNSGLAGRLFSTTRGDLKFNLAGAAKFEYLDYGEWEVAGQSGEDLGTASSSEKIFDITAAFGITLREMFHFGIGFSVKPLFLDLAPAWATIEQLEQKGSFVSYDAGLMLKADFLKDKGFLLSPSVGMSFINLGKGVKFDNQDQTLPFWKKMRYGFGLRFESGSFRQSEAYFGTEIPLVTVTAAYDILVDRIVQNDLMVEPANTKIDDVNSFGTEISLLQVLFLRFGHNDSEYLFGDGGATMWGLGAGYSWNGFAARFDYADVPTAYGTDHRKYGFSVAARF